MKTNKFTIFSPTETLATFETSDEMLFENVLDTVQGGWSSHVRIRIEQGDRSDVYKMEEIP